MILDGHRIVAGEGNTTDYEQLPRQLPLDGFVGRGDPFVPNSMEIGTFRFNEVL